MRQISDAIRHIALKVEIPMAVGRIYKAYKDRGGSASYEEFIAFLPQFFEKENITGANIGILIGDPNTKIRLPQGA